ncbi:hypothetical protein BaRGS_00031871 [Batillaria attramentaria]|uniref:C2H2-type domain-containing protein n=1 Tax=Batillaria attramentaria TaxID=370345 RepID=A0ABD0JPW5_9CAEN
MVDKDDGIVNESEAQKGGSAETQHPNQETNPLEAHVPKKKKHRPKMCSMCGKTMSREFTLKRHIELVHLKDSHSVVCPEEGCNKTFSRTKYLVAHMGDVHMNSTGETQTCHKCGKTFSSKKALADHSRYHGEIYNCTQCGANFPSRSSLYDHKRMCGTCEPISSPCGKIYQSSSGLWKHKKTCSLCIRSMTDSHISSTFNNDVPLNLSTSASTIHEAREPSTLLTPQSAS